jgi:hypothetical protein
MTTSRRAESPHLFQSQTRLAEHPNWHVVQATAEQLVCLHYVSLILNPVDDPNARVMLHELEIACGWVGGSGMRVEYAHLLKPVSRRGF